MGVSWYKKRMIAVVQRVLQASVVVERREVARIQAGVVALVAVQKGDSEEDCRWMASKLATLRIFRNADKHFDLDVTQIGGAILLVSNFTVAAETRKGRRPSLDGAASPAEGLKMFDALVECVRGLGVKVETGRFGADMQVHLINDGPATFLLDSRSA